MTLVGPTVAAVVEKLGGKKSENRQNVGGQTMLSGTRKLRLIMRGIRRQPRKKFKPTFGMKKQLRFIAH